MNIGYIALMLAAGTGIALQVAFNSRLRETIHSPIASSFISLIVSLLSLAPLLVAGVFGRPDMSNIGTVPGWAWIGGIMGAFYLTASVIALPKLGASLVICCGVTAQLITAFVIDTFGLFDVAKVPVTPWRMLGIIFLLFGLVLMQRR